MKIPLSKRLLTCCSFVRQGDRVADIGTDHGYLGIWLLQQGKASSVIAADIVSGPLSAAKRNAARFGFADKMEFYLSDGVLSVPRDFDTMVCAGMGADTMISILSAASWLKDSRYRLILQCQSKTPSLRRYLSEEGFRIDREAVIRDGRFLYTVMEVTYAPGTVLTPGQLYFPPALLLDPSPQVSEYYQDVLFRLRRVLRGQGDHADPQLLQALAELEALTDNPDLIFLKEEST